MNNIPKIPPDLHTYIKVITGDMETSVTFQTFSDKREDNHRAKILHGSISKLFPKLQTVNEKGSGIFLMINEGNLKGRKAENVISVRAVFADCDGTPYKPAANLLTPHIIVETSPGKHHLFWLVTDCPLDEFSTIQKAIAQQFGSDPAVHDLARVMRLPGFLHQKAETPFNVRIVETKSIPPYSKQEIIDSLELDLSVQIAPKRSQSLSRMVAMGQKSEVIDKETGEIFSLKNWALECPDFLIADALKCHSPENVIGSARDNLQHIRCPFSQEHTDPSDDNATFCINGTVSNTAGLVIKCLHAHCTGRDRLDYIQQMLVLGWLPLEALTDQQFLAERVRPKWIKYPIDDLARCPIFNALNAGEKGLFLHCQHISLTIGEGTCPDDSALMARLLGISVEEWKLFRETCISISLWKGQNGRLLHDGTLSIYEVSRRAYEKEVRCGRRGGMSKNSSSSSP